MKINGVSGVSAGAGTMGMNQVSDPESREIQRQITDAQKKLQELSSNENMSMEEKMKKRQEIQKQISDLNMQLRQHQMELRRQAAEEAKEQKTQEDSVNDLTDGKRTAGAVGNAQQAAGLSKGSMQAMISADASMKQAKVQGNVARQMEGRAGVLEAEIKLDSGRGWSVDAKKQELAEVKEKAEAATSSQMSTLADAGKAVKEAGKAEQKEAKGKTEEEKEEEQKEQEKDEGLLAKSEGVEKSSEEAAKILYTPVDVRL